MYVRVHALPGARKEKVTEEKPQHLTISVREEAIQNQANKCIRELVAQRYKVLPQQVRLLTGHRSSSKMYSVDEKGD